MTSAQVQIERLKKLGCKVVDLNGTDWNQLGVRYAVYGQGFREYLLHTKNLKALADKLEKEKK